MGLYYRAILSSLLPNFLPWPANNLPLYPTIPHPVFFITTMTYTFFPYFLHITADFQQVKKKNKTDLTSLPLSGQLTFCLISFFTKKSPFFVRTVVQNWQKLTTIPTKMVISTSTPLPTRENAKKWPLTCIAGALTVVSNSLWRMACPHIALIDPGSLTPLNSYNLTHNNH